MAVSSVERIGLAKGELEDLKVTEEDRRVMFAITPLEGRYEKYVKDFHLLTSEFEWVRRRVWIEAEYVIALADFIAESKTKKRKILEKLFNEGEQRAIRELYEKFDEKNFLQIKKIEEKTNHDVVAVIRWMDYKLSQKGISIEEAIHFGRTSADIDSNVYTTVLRDIIDNHYLPLLIKVQEKLIENAKNWNLVFAGQTHGQWAEYTTLKKVFANFVDGINQALSSFYCFDYSGNPEKPLPSGKLGGAIGNNSDIVGAYPDLDWEKFNREFIEKKLGLKYYSMADQDGFNIRNNKLFDSVTRVNDVLIKLCEDFWEYCSRGVLVKKPKPGESGSSVMAQKANPWRIEGGWEYLSDVDFYKYHNLTKYKRQGDLRRSIRMRTIGEPFAKCIIAMNRILEELNLYEPNKEQIEKEVTENIGMSSAYIQTVLRREGKSDAYDAIKKISMGKQVGLEDYWQVLDELVGKNEVTKEIADEIKVGMKPENNTGLANALADQAIKYAEEQIKMFKKLFNIS
ncbi:MAG: lyase family protein [Patescibacteria group bacterium]|nr:lyase family protein [Patescibacteria group bacterium]MCL5094195.1 lyase family protein [Patescibacteria group bacterium]